MAKIRGIHPHTWTDENFVELTPLARLLFIGLWNYACDNGHLEDRSKQIKLRLLPADDCSVAELLRELADNGRITREDGWITVPNLARHQRIDKRWFVTCGKPGCTKPEAGAANPKPQPRSGHDEATTGARGGHDGATTGPRDDVDVDVDVDLMVKKNKRSADADREFEEFWTRYPRKESRAAARKAWTGARKKCGPAEIIDLTRSYSVRMAGADPKFIPHGSTWLNQERWEDERTAQAAEKEGGSWVTHWTPPAAPPDIADDPQLYSEWIAEQRKAAGR